MSTYEHEIILLLDVHGDNMDALKLIFYRIFLNNFIALIFQGSQYQFDKKTWS